ncbi:phage major capsid protein [Nocardioides pakistanensis]
MSNTLLRVTETFRLSEDLNMVGEGPSLRRQRARANPSYRDAMVAAKNILDEARNGSKAALLRLNEAVTTSDLFKSALGDVLDREMVAQYDDIETQWTKFSTRTTVKDFRPKRLVELSRNRHALRRVPEHTNYPVAKIGAEERTIQVGKFGERYGYSLEARINDDIGELEVIPAGWATQARYTEDDVSLEALANPVTGAPNTAFFNAGNSNLGTGLLTAENLQAAITQVSTKRDKDGRLLRPGPLQLVVGPALQFTAERIMNTTEIEVTEADGSRVKQSNPFRGKVQLTVLANLPGTAWFVIPVPTAPRPAFYTAFLRGFETPDMRYKNDQGQRVGGGNIGPEEGSFDDDTIWYRVRHIVGAAEGDPMFTFASDGLAA